MDSRQIALSPWAANIAPSPTLAVTAKAKALKAAGEDVCGFGAGEPDFDTPDFLKEACIEALRAGHTKYVAAAGLPELRTELARTYVERYGVTGVTAEHVSINPGGKFSCYLAILATCGPGDEVIVPAPYWVSYPELVKLAGATPVIVEAGSAQGFKITPAQLEAAVTKQTKLVILNSPSNPTGAVYTKAEMEALYEVVLRHGLLVLSDEIYEHLLYDDLDFPRPSTFSEEAASCTLIASGFSKTFSMTGWRLGTLVAPKAISKAVGSLQSQTSSNATSFAQYGALEALKQWDRSMQAVGEMRLVFDRRRLAMLESLNAMSGVSCLRAQGAFYLFPDISATGLDSTEFSARLLEEEKVAVVPGIAFGDDACVRLSYACSDEVIAKGLERMARFCTKLSA